MNVQGWIANDPAEDEGERYESVRCLACTRTHLVNVKTGDVLGAEEG